MFIVDDDQPVIFLMRIEYQGGYAIPVMSVWSTYVVLPYGGDWET